MPKTPMRGREGVLATGRTPFLEVEREMLGQTGEASGPAKQLYAYFYTEVELGISRKIRE
jgi:hypothetical protein